MYWIWLDLVLRGPFHLNYPFVVAISAVDINYECDMKLFRALGVKLRQRLNIRKQRFITDCM